MWSLKQTYNQEKVQNAYKALNIDENIRIQQLNLDTIIKLYEQLESN
nr:hypothetical protein [Mycoplasmopsis bovis]